MRGRELSLLLHEPDLTAFLLALNNTDRWTLHLRYDPTQGQQPADHPAPVVLAIVRRVLGLPELPVRILSVLPWQPTGRTVEQARVGRVFLAGDAAHIMTPYAGKGAAAGVQDVHNLAWKLAAVLRAQAGPASYLSGRATADWGLLRQPLG